MKKTKRIKKMNWFYATVVLVILGISLLSYGVYSSNISSHTMMGESGNAYQFETIEDPFEKLHIKKIMPTVFGIMDFDPTAIDQIQDSFPNGLNCYIGTGPAGNVLPRQLGYNDREPWNGFEVIIGRHGMPTEPLYIGVRADTSTILDPLTGTYQYLGYIEASDLPSGDTFYWVGSDQIISIIGTSTWSIILYSYNNGGTDDFWMWACSDQNPYSRGTGEFWDGSSWQPDSSIDLCFRTYTIPNGGGDPPDITISATYAVIPMFFGGLSLIAAVATGSKFYLFV